MATNAKPINFVRGFQLRGAAASAGRFLWHYLQMIVAMEAGMMVYHRLIYPVLAPTGLGALTDQYPMVGYWMMVGSMVLPMIALMGYHRSTWRYSLEMTAAMIAPLAALTVLGLCAVLPIHTLYAFGDPLMFLAMVAFMLFRPHVHTHGGHEHTGHPHSSSTTGETNLPTSTNPEQHDGHACHAA